ncbi:MAG TPA: hypothetical protein VE621_22855, partial [Bryobacteraceae bacterium]|nr:hypothetical protein [Bryobacteraceae bacterium]
MRTFALSIAMMAIGVACLAQTTPGRVVVVNYANLTGTFPVAPGSIASAYGSFGSVTATAASTLNPMPRELAGLRVRIGSTDAPLYFVSTGQINFVVPVGAQSGPQTIQVLSGSNVVASGTVSVYDFAPGLATSDPAPGGPLQAIALNQNNTVNSQSARARRGEVVQLYATGCGGTNPAVQDGVPASGVAPAAATVKAYISVLEA